MSIIDCTSELDALKNDPTDPPLVVGCWENNYALYRDPDAGRYEDEWKEDLTYTDYDSFEEKDVRLWLRPLSDDEWVLWEVTVKVPSNVEVVKDIEEYESDRELGRYNNIDRALPAFVDELRDRISDSEDGC